MNEDTLGGAAHDIGGKAKEKIGSATGDEHLEAEGHVDQLFGQAQKAFGEAVEAAQPILDKARAFVKENPFAMLGLAAIVGAATIGSIRASHKD